MMNDFELASCTDLLRYFADKGTINGLDDLTTMAERARVEGDLVWAFALDNLSEDWGMNPDDRATCYSCRTWASSDHLASDQHRHRFGL